MAPLFFLDDVTMERVGENRQTQVVFKGLTVAIPDAEIVCITGASGSGKSTLLRLLNRLEDPAEGRVLFRGRDLCTLDPLELRRRVALVSQTPIMLPGTVQDNLEAGLRVQGKRLDEPCRWLDQASLPVDILEKDAHELSGGEKQRVALLRTLVTGPEVLLLDEVTSSLDPETTLIVERLILQQQLPTVWVSHEMEQVKRVADHVLHLDAGVLKEVVYS